MIIHVVEQGDSIYKISRQHGVPADTIISANRLPNPENLVIGQAIVVPGDQFSYTVSRGETMYSIAKKFGIPLRTLLDANPDVSPNSLHIGQTVIIPLPPQKKGSIFVNGYAFPSIDAEVLRDTLLYLSFLSIFSYQVKPDGSLKNINDSEPIKAALNARTAPLMVITNIEEGAGFSSELAHGILTNLQIQNTLINNVTATLKEKGYSGLDVDFEYLYPEDRQNYTDFISRVVNKLRPLGYSISVAVAPKNRADQVGLLYEAHDYPALGALVDHVIIMTYEWGYLKGPAMAVAPINEVRKVLDYATSVIPNEKILMGMPNYGYDWTLPFVRGSSAKILTNYGAVLLAARVGANIRYDNTSQAPFFNYYDGAGKRHEVWFDDARSIAARLALVDEYKLGGVSYWTVNNFFATNWLVLTSMYDVKKVK